MCCPTSDQMHSMECVFVCMEEKGGRGHMCVVGGALHIIYLRKLFTTSSEHVV